MDKNVCSCFFKIYNQCRFHSLFQLSIFLWRHVTLLNLVTLRFDEFVLLFDPRILDNDSVADTGPSTRQENATHSQRGREGERQGGGEWDEDGWKGREGDGEAENEREGREGGGREGGRKRRRTF